MSPLGEASRRESMNGSKARKAKEAKAKCKRPRANVAIHCNRCREKLSSRRAHSFTRLACHFHPSQPITIASKTKRICSPNSASTLCLPNRLPPRQHEEQNHKAHLRPECRRSHRNLATFHLANRSPSQNSCGTGLHVRNKRSSQLHLGRRGRRYRQSCHTIHLPTSSRRHGIFTVFLYRPTRLR